jgi:uncharacterized integral membrane protein
MAGSYHMLFQFNQPIGSSIILVVQQAERAALVARTRSGRHEAIALIVGAAVAAVQGQAQVTILRENCCTKQLFLEIDTMEIKFSQLKHMDLLKGGNILHMYRF